MKPLFVALPLVWLDARMVSSVRMTVELQQRVSQDESSAGNRMIVDLQQRAAQDQSSADTLLTQSMANTSLERSVSEKGENGEKGKTEGGTDSAEAPTEEQTEDGAEGQTEDGVADDAEMGDGKGDEQGEYGEDDQWEQDAVGEEGQQQEDAPIEYWDEGEGEVVETPKPDINKSQIYEILVPPWFKKVTHRRRVGWYKTMARSCSEEGTKCEQLVKKSMTSMDCSAAEDIDKCINNVLTANQYEHGKQCCEPGTEYDDVIIKKVSETRKFEFDAQTAVFVVDVQRDFTNGIMPQPCWGTGGENFLKGIMDFTIDAASSGATIIATKDFHPVDHCSFAGQSDCTNADGYANETSDSSNRYVNDFPSHCSWSEFVKPKQRNDRNRYAKPVSAKESPFCKNLQKTILKNGVPTGHICSNPGFIGADFERAFSYVLSKLPASQVEVVFKGFRKEYEAFSGLEGYALPPKRAKLCHGKWHTLRCYPSEKELTEPDENMRAVLDIVKAKKIKKVYVVGLVFDYSVRDTALAAMAGARSVTVVANLARPSFDGKPGAPYVSSLCDGGQADGSFCTQGGGTSVAHERVVNDLLEGGVEIARHKRRKSRC